MTALLIFARALFGKFLQSVGEVLRAIPWWAWLAAGALLAAYLYGEARHADGVAETTAEYEARLAREADQAARFLAEATEDNRLREQALSDQLLQAQADHEKHVQDVQARADRTVADLRAGTVQLRQHWKACLARPVPGPGATADDPGRADADAELRAADIGNLQGIGGHCDADVKWWQDTWKAAERAVNSQ